MRSTDNGQRRRSGGRWLVAVAGIALGCASGPSGSLPPPTDIAPQPQAELSEQLNRAMDDGSYEALVDLVRECHNVDLENDGVAKRDPLTPVFED